MGLRHRIHAYISSHAALALTILQLAAHSVGRMLCPAAVLVVLPYLVGDCATPGGGTTRRLTLRRRVYLFLTIASTLLGVGMVPKSVPGARVAMSALVQ